MSLMTLLFPEVEAARKAALARINALKARSDEFDRSQEAMRAVAAKVFPLAMAVEDSGARATKVYLPPDDLKALQIAADAQSAYWGRDYGGPVEGARLFGLKVVAGDELRVE